MEYIDSKPDFSKEPFLFPEEKFNQLIYDGVGEYYSCMVENKLKNNFSNDLSKLNNIVSKSCFNISFNNISFENKNNHLKLKNFSYNYDENEGEMILRVFRKNGNVSIVFDYMLLLKCIDKRGIFHIFMHGLLSDHLFGSVMRNSYYISSFNHGIFNGTAKKGPFHDLANDMSNELFGGNLIFDDTNEEIKFVDERCGAEFDFSLVSSSVRELILLIEYLKDELEVGDTLILEEPENHLHPLNQRILARYLVEAVNMRLNIILTTHSDYILEQFNNLIRLGEVSDDKLADLKYCNEDILNPDDIRIYNFKRQSDYSYIAENVNVNETGFVDENFTDVSDDLYNESVEIINSMTS